MEHEIWSMEYYDMNSEMQKEGGQSAALETSNSASPLQIKLSWLKLWSN